MKKGKISVDKSIIKNKFLPLKLYFAKANPAIELDKITKTMVLNETIKLFKNARPKFAKFQTIKKLSNTGFSGKKVGGILKISSFVLNAERIM